MSERQRIRPRRAETRLRVIDAAAAVFDERGYDGASLDQIAERAGLTKGAIYSNFGGKDELFQAVVSRQVEKRLAAVALVTGDADREAVAHRIGAALADATGAAPDWHVAFIEYWIRAVRDPGLLESFSAHRKAARETITSAIRAQQEHWGVRFALEPQRLAVVILALSNGLAIESSTGDVDGQLFGDVLAQLLRPLQGHPEHS